MKRRETSVHAVVGRAFAIAAVASLVLVWGTGTDFGAGCVRQFGNHDYQCSVKSSAGGDFQDCFHFTSPGTVLPEGMDLLIDGLSATPLVCSCWTKGPYSDPTFNATAKFECISPSSTAFDITFFAGSPDGGKTISGGQAVSEEGWSFFFKCKRVAMCSVSLVGSGPDGEQNMSPWMKPAE